MLSPQQTLQLSAYADLYDKVVPQKHMLRQINDLVDFSFVYQELVTKYCLIMVVVQKVRYVCLSTCY